MSISEFSSLEKVAIANLKYYHTNHAVITENIANASTPGYKTQVLTRNKHSSKYNTDFEEYITRDANSDTIKLNGNSVNVEEEQKKADDNKSMIDLWQSIAETLFDCKDIIVGIKK